MSQKGKPKIEAKGIKRNGSEPTISAPYPVGEISLPVISKLAKGKWPDNEQATPPSRQVSLPVYGNYCGRGHGDPTGSTPPIDAVDAVCREHNMCYRRLGDFDSRCDRELVESMPVAIENTPSPTGKNAGLLAMLYFAVAERNLALGETLFRESGRNRRES